MATSTRYTPPRRTLWDHFGHCLLLPLKMNRLKHPLQIYTSLVACMLTSSLLNSPPCLKSEATKRNLFDNVLAVYGAIVVCKRHLTHDHMQFDVWSYAHVVCLYRSMGTEIMSPFCQVKLTVSDSSNCGPMHPFYPYTLYIAHMILDTRPSRFFSWIHWKKLGTRLILNNHAIWATLLCLQQFVADYRLHKIEFLFLVAAWISFKLPLWWTLLPCNASHTSF